MYFVGVSGTANGNVHVVYGNVAITDRSVFHYTTYPVSYHNLSFDLAA